MAGKLKSISKQIHWSLLARAAIFALSWFLLPFWLFFFIALYLFFIPFFQVRSLATPFFVVLILALIHGPSILVAVVLFALFYYLLLIKNLLLIDRKSAYELLLFTISFFLLRDFYERFGSGLGLGEIGYGFLVALVIGILIGSFINTQMDIPETKGPRRVAAWLSFLLVWQAVTFGLFLPLDFIYQSIIAFLLVALVIDLVPDYYFGTSSREKLLLTGTTVFSLLAIVLASARWGL